MAEDTRHLFANGAAGLLGLGRSAGNMSFIDAIFREHRGWNALPIGLALDPTNSANAGSMDLHQIDPRMYQGDLHTVAAVNRSQDIPINMPADWALTLDSWAVDVGGIRTEFNTGGVAIIEPYFPEIRLPQELAMKFCKNISFHS